MYLSTFTHLLCVVRPGSTWWWNTPVVSTRSRWASTTGTRGYHDQLYYLIVLLYKFCHNSHKDPDSVKQITISVLVLLRTKALVLELLAAVCLVRGGHDIILSAFDNFREVCSILDSPVIVGVFCAPALCVDIQHSLFKAAWWVHRCHFLHLSLLFSSLLVVSVLRTYCTDLNLLLWSTCLRYSYMLVTRVNLHIKLILISSISCKNWHCFLFNL